MLTTVYLRATTQLLVVLWPSVVSSRQRQTCCCCGITLKCQRTGDEGGHGLYMDNTEKGICINYNSLPECFFPRQNGLYWLDPRQWFTFTSESDGRRVPSCGQFTGSTAAFRVFRQVFRAKTNITNWPLPCRCSNKVTVLMLIPNQCKSNSTVRLSAPRCWFQTFQRLLALDSTDIQLLSGVNSQLTL